MLQRTWMVWALCALGCDDGGSEAQLIDNGGVPVPDGGHFADQGAMSDARAPADARTSSDAGPSADAAWQAQDAAADGGSPTDAHLSDQGAESDAGAPPEGPARVGIGGLYVPANVASAMDRAQLQWFELEPQRDENGELDVSAIIEGIDCLVLPGGADIDPARYGEEAHPTVSLISAARAELDFALIEAATERGLPILGICLGAQEVNVARGGALVQDIPSEIIAPLDHRSNHDIEIVPGTLMRQMYNRDRLTVVSRHHQAAEHGDGLGEGLRISAWSSDGVVEAIEPSDPEAPWLFGTQYHAESQLDSDVHDGMWRAFGAACEAYRAAHPGRPSPEPAFLDDYGACQSDLGAGVCVHDEECVAWGGQARSGFCPGPAAIQCCTQLSCTAFTGQAGECFASALCDQLGGVRERSSCPGGPSVNCCFQASVCEVDDGRAGECLPNAECDSAGGFRERGHCPGPAGIQCCVREE